MLSGQITGPSVSLCRIAGRSPRAQIAAERRRSRSRDRPRKRPYLGTGEAGAVELIDIVVRQFMRLALREAPGDGASFAVADPRRTSVPISTTSAPMRLTRVPSCSDLPFFRQPAASFSWDSDRDPPSRKAHPSSRWALAPDPAIGRRSHTPSPDQAEDMKVGGLAQSIRSSSARQRMRPYRFVVVHGGQIAVEHRVCRIVTSPSEVPGTRAGSFRHRARP